MKTKTRLVLIILLLNSMSSFADIPVLSMNTSGRVESTVISDDDYQKVLTLQADTSAQAAEDQLVNTTPLNNLTLKGILVGLEAQGTIGIGAFNIGAGVNQQFYFEIRN